MHPRRTPVFTLAAILSTASLSAADYRISGPYSHSNLSIYLIHTSTQTARHFLTLQEALRQKKAVVYETGNVNELAIENLSPSDEIYVQSGEIVKGGQQDRTFKDDLILPTRSGRIPISAFCVEHGRWSRRGEENVSHFDAAPQAVATREMKQAVKLSANQTEVWNKVASTQRALSFSAGSVHSSASPTSFMLSLESPGLQQHVEEYIQALAGIIHEKDVVGYAFAVNGNLSSADLYASTDLFRSLWPKLLRSSAVEAVAAQQAEAKAPPAAAAVHAWLSEPEHARASVHDLTARTRVIVKQTGRDALFETRDRAYGGALVHSSYLSKE